MTVGLKGPSTGAMQEAVVPYGPHTSAVRTGLHPLFTGGQSVSERGRDVCAVDPCVRAGAADFTADDGTQYTPSGTVAFDLSITDIDLTGVRASFSYEATQDNSTAFSVEVGRGGWILSPVRRQGKARGNRTWAGAGTPLWADSGRVPRSLCRSHII